MRIDDEGCRVFRPGIADGLKGCSPAQRFEVFGEVVGGDEGAKMGLQAVEGLVMEDSDGSVLDGPVHSLGLAVIRHDGRRRFHTLPLVGDMVRPSGLWGAGST